MKACTQEEAPKYNLDGGVHHSNHHANLLNAFPVISQAKSGYQALRGDRQGARDTQIAFTRSCPLVSPARAAVEAASGDKAAAKETGRQTLKVGKALSDKIPVVGHVKAVYHTAHAFKHRKEEDVRAADKAKAQTSLMLATRTTVVYTSGALAFAGGCAATLGMDFGAAGVAAAAATGIAAGTAYDGAVSAATGKRQGIFAVGHKVKRGALKPGEEFDAMFIPIGDGLAGYAGFGMAEAGCAHVASGGVDAQPAAADMVTVTKDVTVNALKAAKVHITTADH